MKMDWHWEEQLSIDVTDTMLEIINNETTLIEHSIRTIADRDGQFILKSEPADTVLLIARDVQNRFAIYSSSNVPADQSLLPSGIRQN